MTATGPAPWMRRVLVAGIVAAWVGLTYNPQWGWWISAVASGAILLLGRLAFGASWAERLGLSTGARGALVFLAATLAFLPAMIAVIHFAAHDAGLSFSALAILDRPTSVTFTFYQTFNEEMVVGALLLFTLSRRLPRRRGLISVSVATVFALMHVALYGSPHQEFVYGAKPVVLNLPTVLTLFAVGVFRNNAILARGDISLAWALHLAFNIPFFVGDLWSGDDGTALSEPEQFDAILGHPLMVVLTVGLALASFGLYRLHPRAPGAERVRSLDGP